MGNGARAERRLIPRTLLALALWAGLAGAVAAQGLCAEDRVTVIGDWGQARFGVAVADEPGERAQGLMYVERMPTMSGMLFVYERPQRASFWMENTLFPLDMIFAGPDGTVTRVHDNAIPLDRTGIDGGPDVQYVLEINGGLAGQLGIAPGDILQHPAIGPDPAAPCG
ncbi:DUF192 domain-containing protein [Roseisalinus antarcticus]|uniref:ACR n=1 Tax=Roseisalinus antarcticus TaxID=254357 RepID=A0A1Y5TB77_9RHOB|nr:DUF192 domain-containing protein [Roseisalinus antarcticus]SLN59801.1 hypothetical protein ROA7023_02750 [Roseisalinus antarcticus]